MSISHISKCFSKCFYGDGNTTRSISGLIRRLATLILVAAFALVVAGCGAADVSGTWEGEMVGEDDDEVLQLTLELEQEGTEITGEGVVESESGDGGPIEVSGGEVEGSQVTIEFQDAFGGQSVQGELNGELNGETMSGEGQAYSANATGPIDDTYTFELQKTES